jgi:hypothetical protein
MSIRNNNKCESCVNSKGGCVDSYSSSNDVQGQINVCPSNSGWNYSQNALFQMRNMPAPSHSFLTTTDPMSFDLSNPERFRPLTHMPIAPQKLTNGSFTLNNDSLYHETWLNRATLNNAPQNLKMYSELPPGNFNSTYCGSEFQDCYYKQGLTRAGPAQDGCVPVSTPCGQALSGI